MSKQNLQKKHHVAKQQAVKVTAKQQKNEPAFLKPLILFSFTLLAYFLSFGNDFIINWDDGGYIINNDYIKSLSADSIGAMFSDFYMSNYHPLTTLSYAIDYSIAGENPVWYHVVNFIFHAANIWLVFVFVKRLLREHSAWVAFAVALIFAVHPMHVESVAWISERKDVLYTFFFLLGLIQYLTWVDVPENHLKNYLLITLFFTLSLLSKSAAVVFPVAVIAIDWYRRQPLRLLTSLVKIPWFVLSLLFGYLALQSQDTAMQDLAPLLTFAERIQIVNVAFLTYLWKFILPVHLSAMYPYPLKENDVLPVIYMIAPLFTIGLGVVVYLLRKNREFIFGLAFFLITIALVLQLVPVGGVILSERYTYIPYIGLAIPVVIWIAKLSLRSKLIKPMFFILIGAFALMSFNRVTYWKNGDVLFTDVVEKYPKLPYAWNNRGFLYWDHYALKVYADQPAKKQMYVNKAYSDFTKALLLDPNYISPWANRAILLYNTGRPEESLSDFNKVLQIDSLYLDGIIGRANTLSTLKKFEQALFDYNRYLKLKPDDARAYVWRATALSNTGDQIRALSDLKTARAMNPNDHEAWYWSGLCHYNLNHSDSALYYFDKTVSLKPDFAEVYIWKGLTWQKKKDFPNAIANYNESLKFNPNDAVALLNRAVARYELNDFDMARTDIEAAMKLNYPVNQDFYQAVLSRDKRFQTQ